MNSNEVLNLLTNVENLEVAERQQLEKQRGRRITALSHTMDNEYNPSIRKYTEGAADRAKVFVDREQFGLHDMIRQSCAYIPSKEVVDLHKQFVMPSISHKMPKINYIETDTVSCILDVVDKHGVDVSCVPDEVVKHGADKVGVLNFASPIAPGGGYLNGAIAQEECLCAESNLFNILSRIDKRTDYYINGAQNLNNHSYTNSYITCQARFERPHRIAICTVVTCAAPNYNGVLSYASDLVSGENTVAKNIRSRIDNANYEKLRYRIRTILCAMKEAGVKYPILGAFGCGVFGQNPEIVGNIFRQELASFDFGFEEVYFAILGKPTFDKFKG